MVSLEALEALAAGRQPQSCPLRSRARVACRVMAYRRNPVTQQTVVTATGRTADSTVDSYHQILKDSELIASLSTAILGSDSAEDANRAFLAALSTPADLQPAATTFKTRPTFTLPELAELREIAKQYANLTDALHSDPYSATPS